MQRIVFACLCAAVLAVLPACSSAGQGVAGASAASTGSTSADSATNESSSGSGSTSSDAAPPAETSGTESARPPQGGQGSLTVASLPIGANADGDGCMTISFEGAASEVPAGMRLVVTDIEFKPQVVQFGGPACPQETPVCRPGLVLTETGNDQCFASITMGGAAVGTSVQVQVKANVDCTGGQVAACTQFKEKIDSDEKSNGIATFEVPEPNQPETTPTDQSPSPSESAAVPSDSVTTSSS